MYTIFTENKFQFILDSYFISHKTIIQEISRILNPAFLNLIPYENHYVALLYNHFFKIHKKNECSVYSILTMSAD